MAPEQSNMASMKNNINQIPNNIITSQPNMAPLQNNMNQEKDNMAQSQKNMAPKQNILIWKAILAKSNKKNILIFLF